MDELLLLNPPTWVIGVVVLLMLAVVCFDVVAGARDHARFRAAIAAASSSDVENVRARFLWKWAWQPWILAIATVVFVVVAPGVDLRHVGLQWPDATALSGLFEGSFGKGLVIGVVLAGVGLAVGVIAGWRRRNVAAEGTSSARGVSVAVNSRVEPMLPTGKRDRLAWLVLSLTAGVTEEVMYRGLLLLSLVLVMPDAPDVVIGAIAALVFGFAHVYQGWVGMLTTAVLAAPLILLYVLTGSLVPGMILHFLIDARAAFVKRSVPLSEERV